jgi:hypothetical protein
MVEVVVALREVRVGDEGESMLEHTYEVEKRFYWGTNTDLKVKVQRFHGGLRPWNS